MKPYNSRTILPNGEGQIIGRKGELLFIDHLKALSLDFQDIGDQMKFTDIIVNNVKIDVKIKGRTVPAKMHYDAHVQLCQRYPEKGDEAYDPHIYVFGTATNGEVSLLAWCRKKWFWQNCQIVRKGDPDGDSYREMDDAGKMPYNRMHPLDTLWPALRTAQHINV